MTSGLAGGHDSYFFSMCFIFAFHKIKAHQDLHYLYELLAIYRMASEASIRSFDKYLSQAFALHHRHQPQTFSFFT